MAVGAGGFWQLHCGPDCPSFCLYHRSTPRITPAIISRLAPQRLWVHPRACQVCGGLGMGSMHYLRAVPNL